MSNPFARTNELRALLMAALTADLSVTLAEFEQSVREEEQDMHLNGWDSSGCSDDAPIHDQWLNSGC